MARLNIEAVKRMTDRTEKLVKDSTRKQLSIYGAAAAWRKKDREDEYRDWQIATEVYLGDWTELEHKKIEATREAIDSMQDGLTNFFEDTIVDARNWKDHIVNFLRDIQRAMARAFAVGVAEEIMATSLAQSITGGLLGGLGKRTATVSPDTSMRLATAPHGLAAGGIVRRPTIGLIGEKGAEAVVPLSGGRSIPVDIAGGMPNVVVNVINQTSRPISAQRSAVRFDGKKLVTEIILQDSAEYGPLRQAGIIS